MMNYNQLGGLLSMVFKYNELENGMNSILEGEMMYGLCDVEPQEIELAKKKVKNKAMMVKQTIQTLEHTSWALDLDVSDSLETLRELQSILAFVYEKIANE